MELLLQITAILDNSYDKKILEMIALLFYYTLYSLSETVFNFIVKIDIDYKFLTYTYMIFVGGQFRRNYLRHMFWKCVWKL